MNKALTIDELKALQVDDWVWLIDINELGHLSRGSYRQIDIINDDICYFDGTTYGRRRYSEYGIKWLAYKNKEQAENTQMTNAEKSMILYLIYDSGADTCSKCIHLNKPTCGRYISPTDYSGECSDDCCIDGMLQYFERESDIK